MKGSDSDWIRKLDKNKVNTHMKLIFIYVTWLCYLNGFPLATLFSVRVIMKIVASFFIGKF